MDILLPYARPEYPWYKRLVIHLFNWVAWIVPAMADCGAADMGEKYQAALTFIVASTIAFMLAIQIFATTYFGLTWQQDILATFVAYLLFGALYHLHERRWNM